MLVLVPTLNSLSLYGVGLPAPIGANGDDDARVTYRRVGSTEWRRGIDSWFDRRPIVDDQGNQYGGQEYRSSIVGLIPNADYEVMMQPKGREPVTATVRTRPDFDLDQIKGEVRELQGFEITEGGTPDNWKIYDCRGIDIDSPGLEYGLVINASYVVVWGLNVKNVKRHCIRIGPSDSLNMADLHDIWITECDLSKWGSAVESGPLKGFGRNVDSAIFSASGRLRRLTISRNMMHDPNFGSNSWIEPGRFSGRKHPEGPQCITLNRDHGQDSELGYSSGKEPPELRVRNGSNIPRILDGTAVGNHVIRYCSMWPDSARQNVGDLTSKRFNDHMGTLSDNFSNVGFVGSDSDIHGNYFEGSWDDVGEFDGGLRNVRVWGNYIDRMFGGFSHQGITGGPVYYWKNAIRASNSDRAPALENGRLIKTSSLPNGVGNYLQQGGRHYHFNNASLDVSDGDLRGVGIWLGDGWKGSTEKSANSKVRNARAYNCIMRSDPRRDFGAGVYTLAMGQPSTDLTDLNRVDYCLISAFKQQGAGTKGYQGDDAVNAHGWSNANAAVDFDADYDGLKLPEMPTVTSGLLTGRYKLAEGSKGRGKGLPIPNFTAASDVDIGPGPDVIEYGPKAYRNATGASNGGTEMDTTPPIDPPVEPGPTPAEQIIELEAEIIALEASVAAAISSRAVMKAELDGAMAEMKKMDEKAKKIAKSSATKIKNLNNKIEQLEATIKKLSRK